MSPRPSLRDHNGSLSTVAALAEARQRAETIGALFDLAIALSEVGTLEEVADRLARAVPGVVDGDGAAVFVWEPGDAVLVCKGCSDRPVDVSEAPRVPGASDSSGTRGKSARFALDRTLLSQLTRHPEPLLFGPHGPSTTWREIGTLAGYRAGVVMPVVARHRLLGLVVTGSDRWSSTAGGEGWRERLHGVASVAATAFDNALLLDQIRHQAGHDALTGLANARLLEELAGAAMSTARRHGYGVGVLFVDLDLFKSVNDRLGHHVGDQVLVEVGSRLRTAVRTGDTVARLGGDEFAVLLPHVADVAGACAVATRILGVLREPVSSEGVQTTVSASIGIAVSSDASISFDTLLRKADGAMYRAKADGRARYRFVA